MGNGDFFNKIRIKEEAQKFLREIDIVLDSYFRIGEKAKKDLFESKLSYPTAQYFQKLMETLGKDHTLFEKSLQDLKATIESAPVCSITISFDPHESTINKLSDWVRTNFDKTTLLDLSIDPRILGGAKIAFQGHYKDISLKTKLDEYFAADEVKRQNAKGKIEIQKH